MRGRKSDGHTKKKKKVLTYAVQQHIWRERKRKEGKQLSLGKKDKMRNEHKEYMKKSREQKPEGTIVHLVTAKTVQTKFF